MNLDPMDLKLWGNLTKGALKITTEGNCLNQYISRDLNFLKKLNLIFWGVFNIVIAN